jgi:hypothetical protein
MSITDPEILFQDIWNDLETSMSAMENGGNIDMASLDNKVRNFCAIVKTLPAKDAKLYQAKMEQIINYLTELVTKLTKAKDALSVEIDMADQRQRAHMAYGNARLYTVTDGE